MNKKVLSLALAVMMVLGAFSTVFAASAHTEAGELLEQLNVLKGDEKGLRLEEPLTRREMTVMVSRLYGKEDEARDFKVEEVKFEDVKGAFAGYINWAASEELVRGYEDETFKPLNNLTVQEYAKILLVALGHDEFQESKNWNKVESKATELGLMENVEAKKADEVTRGQMAEMTLNALNTKVKDGSKTLAEKLEIEMPKAPVTDLEMVKKPYADNLAEIKFELNDAKLANQEELLNKANYRVSGVSVANVVLDGNTVILELEDNKDEFLSQIKDTKLVIRGEKEIAGTYTFRAVDTKSPEVVKVEALGEYGIKVTTSEPIKNPLERHFLLDGKNVVMIVEQYGREIILTPYHNRAFPEGEVELTVTALMDYAGFRAEPYKETIEIAKNEELPKVVKATGNQNEVIVEFDTDVYRKSVAKTNALFVDGRHEIKATAAEKVDTNKVKYTFENGRIDRRAFTMTVKNVENHSKLAMNKDEEVKVDMTRDLTDPIIINNEIVRVDENTLRVELEFDKALNTEVKDDKTTLKYGDIELYQEKVNKDNNKTVEIEKIEMLDNGYKVSITVKTTNLDAKKVQILEVYNFEDKAGNRMYREYIEFNIPKVLQPLKVDRITKSSKDIEIVFSNPVDREVAEDGSNYIFELVNGEVKDLRDLGGSVIVERNGYTVTLLVPRLDKGEYKTLEISRIKDIDGGRLEKAVIYNVKEGSFVETKEVLAELSEAIEKAEKVTEKTEKLESAIANAKKVEEKGSNALISEMKAAIKAMEDEIEKIEELNKAKELLNKAEAAVKEAASKKPTTRAGEETKEEAIEFADKAAVEEAVNKALADPKFAVIERAYKVVKEEEAENKTVKVTLTHKEHKELKERVIDFKLKKDAKEDLTAAITAAEEALKTVEEAKKEALTEAIEAAKTALKDEKATVETLTEATTALNGAMEEATKTDDAKKDETKEVAAA